MPLRRTVRVPSRAVRGAILIAVALLSSNLLDFSSVLEAATQRITIRADDGATLTGTWYEPSNRPAPAVILVHMLQKTRRDWDPFAVRLAGEGIGVLTFDLRGHGESTGSPQEYAAMVQDIRAARRFLGTRPDVTPSRIGIAG